MIKAPQTEIVLGPPGTGKTTRLLELLREELAAGTPPDRIGLVTFTRRAATEAQDRVAAEFGLTRSDLPHFRTLHSLCMRAVGVPSGAILQGPRMREFAEWIGEEIEGRFSSDGTWSGYARGDRMLFMDGLARIRCVPLRELHARDHDDLDWVAVERFSRGLRAYKTDNHLHDFTDLLEIFVARRAGPRLEVLFGDEVQDFSNLQWQAFWVLATGARRVVVAGDDDQAIFVWAGADAATLVDLPGRATVLGQSYRVPRAVQHVSAGIISRVHRRREKTWLPRDEEGSVSRIASLEDASLSGDSVLVLARNRHHLDAVESYVRRAGVLYEREGVPSVARRTLEAVVTWERLRRGEPQRVADVAAGPYALMTVGLGVRRGHKRLPGMAPERSVSLNDLKTEGGLLRDDPWHLALDWIPAEHRAYLLACRRNKERLTRPPRVRLSTIHGSKGGEADRVILLTDLAPRTWREATADPDAEARVLYVAVTRARQELLLVRPLTSRHYIL